MSDRAAIISRIKDMLTPKPLMAVYFIQEGTGEIFRYKDKLLTKDECRKIPASRRYFIVAARKDSQVMRLRNTDVYF